jgi:hypothetical protein
MRQSPEVVARAADHLSRARRSPFDDERSTLAGKSFAERFRAAEQRPCGSAPELRWRDPRGDLATVWGRLDRDRAAPAYLVLVDSNGLIRGLGEARPSPPGAEPGRRWGGVIAPFTVGERYAVWAILNDGRSACRAGEIEGLSEAPPRRQQRPPA